MNVSIGLTKMTTTQKRPESLQGRHLELAVLSIGAENGNPVPDQGRLGERARVVDAGPRQPVAFITRGCIPIPTTQAAVCRGVGRVPAETEVLGPEADRLPALHTNARNDAAL